MQHKREIAQIRARLDGMRALCVAQNREATSSERQIVNDLIIRAEQLGEEWGMNKKFAAQTVKLYEAKIRRGETLEKADQEILIECEDILGSMPEIFSRSQNEPLRLDPNGGMSGGSNSSRRGPFQTLGDQLTAIVRASIPGGEVDNRLPQFRAAAGANEGLPSEGGFLVQQDFGTDLLTGTFSTSALAQLCRRLTISANANGMRLPAIDETSRATGSRLGGIQMYWVGEGDPVTANKPKFRRLEVNLKKIMGLCYATDELMADASVLESVLRDGFISETAFMLDDGILNGTGAGQPLGIMNAPCLVTVAKEPSQDAATVVYENLVKMWSRMTARSRLNAVWLINQDIEPQLYTLGLAVGTGGSPIYMPSGGASASPYASLFGRPIIPVEQAATLGTAGDIVLADLSQYLLVDKGGVNFQGSVHVRFIYDEMTFRTTYRVDGQPIPNAATSPYKGTGNTVSPFVTLAARA